MSEAAAFHALSLLLIDPPEASRRALGAAGTEGAGAGGAGGFAVAAARLWAGVLLRPPYAPPDDVPMVAFAREAGLCDTVRCVHRVDDRTLEIAQTSNILSIKALGFDLPGDAPPERRAEHVARAILKPRAEELVLVRLGDCPVGPFGERDFSRVAPRSSEPHWLDALLWWTRDAEVGFLTVRANGAVTRELVSMDASVNRRWFT